MKRSNILGSWQVAREINGDDSDEDADDCYNKGWVAARDEDADAADGDEGREKRRWNDIALVFSLLTWAFVNAMMTTIEDGSETRDGTSHLMWQGIMCLNE